MTTIIEMDYVVEVNDPDMDDTVAHIIHADSEYIALCGVDGRNVKHAETCFGVYVADVRTVAYCPACGVPVCPFCRLLAQGLPFG